MCQYYEVCTRETSHLHCEDLNCDTKIQTTYADKASRRRHYRKNHQHLLRNVGNPRKNNSIANEVNAHVLAEGIATDFHSQLLIAEFHQVHLQSQNNELQESVQQLTSSNNQILTENQTLTSLLDETKTNSATLQGKLDDTAKECQSAKDSLVQNVAFVAQLENTLKGAEHLILGLQANLKEKEEENAALKSLLDARVVTMKPHEPKGNHPRFGMMNLRGCAWNWHIHCPVDKSFSPWTIHFA
jgi:hypothetical protein